MPVRTKNQNYVQDKLKTTPVYPSRFKAPTYYNSCGNTCDHVFMKQEQITGCNVIKSVKTTSPYISITPDQTENTIVQFKGKKYKLKSILVFYAPVHELSKTSKTPFAEMHIEFISVNAASTYGERLTIAVQLTKGSSSGTASNFLKLILDKSGDRDDRTIHVDLQEAVVLNSLLSEKNKGYFYYHPQSSNETLQFVKSSRKIAGYPATIEKFFVLVYEDMLDIDEEVIDALLKNQKVKFIANDNPISDIFYWHPDKANKLSGTNFGQDYDMQCVEVGEIDDVNDTKTLRVKSSYETGNAIIGILCLFIVPIYLSAVYNTYILDSNNGDSKWFMAFKIIILVIPAIISIIIVIFNSANSASNEQYDESNSIGYLVGQIFLSVIMISVLIIGIVYYKKT